MTALIIIAWIYIILMVLLLSALILPMKSVLAKIAADQSPEVSDVPVSIIIPVKGADKDFESCVKSWLNTEYNGPFEIIYSLQDETDPAIAILQKHECTFIVNPIKENMSGKMSNWSHGLATAQYDNLVFCDADVTVNPDTLQKTVNKLEQRGGIVTAICKHQDAKNWPATVYQLTWNFALISAAWLATYIPKFMPGITGAMNAMRRETLQKLGGIEAIQDYIAEDLQMGRCAAQHNIPVHLGEVIRSPVGKMSLKRAWFNARRGALITTTMNSARSTLFVHALVNFYWVILIVGLCLHSKYLIILAIVFMIFRCLIFSVLNKLATGESTLVLSVFAMDLMMLSASVTSLFSKRLNWAGVTYQVQKGGRLRRR